MKIEFKNKPNKHTFSEVKYGDLFAHGDGKELYMKTFMTKGGFYNAVSVRNGRFSFFSDSVNVDLVKSIKIELE